MWNQTTKVTPNIPCKPGWCLAYVQQALNAPWSGATATQGWELTKFKHKNKSFPSGVAVPVWFAMKGVPEGHVALRMKDGSYYSTSHPTSNRPTHHPNLQHLLDYYGGRLTLRGWSEDMNGYRVVKKEEKDMITENGVHRITRFRYGRTATKAELTEWPKKYTEDQADKVALRSSEYKKWIAEVKKSKAVPVNGLTQAIRKVFGVK